ncbi:MAG: hypothetical protein MJZ20_12005 [Bacteroidaceae bacterium]|nr:hypothetical protein [Bacteroidaceae bacterium]
MAIGDTLTRVKTEVGIPWYKAFGVMQHLTPSTARTMLQIPWYAWEDNGIETRLQITRIPVQPPAGTPYPIISIGLKGIGGLGATISNNIITKEGNIRAECETQCISSVYGNVDHTIYGGFLQGDTVDMIFYTNLHNEIYIGLSYGSAGNKTTAFKFLYKRNDTGIETSSTTTVNSLTYPSIVKDLYIDGVSADANYNAVALSILYKACSFDFCVSCSLFATENGLQKFKETGDTSEEIEALTNTDPGEDRTTVLFLEAQEYKSEFSIRQPNEKVGNKKRIEFYVRNTKDTGEKIQYIDRAVWGFVHNDSIKSTKTEYVIPSNILDHSECNWAIGQDVAFSTSNSRGVVKDINFVANKTYHLTCDNPNLYECYLVTVNSLGKITSYTEWLSLPYTYTPTTSSRTMITYRLKTNSSFTLSTINPSVYTVEGGGALTDYKNITFVRNNAFEVYKILENDVDVTRSYDWSRRFTVWKNNVLYNEEYYWSNIVTNMFIFETYQKGLDAIQSGIIDGLLSDTPIPDTAPTPLADNEIDYDGGMSETFLLTKADINKLADRLTIEVSTDGSVLRNMFVGLSMHNNPIDVVIDLFALPIKIDDFVETEEADIDFNPRTHQDPNDSGDTPPSNT